MKLIGIGRRRLPNCVAAVVGDSRNDKVTGIYLAHLGSSGEDQYLSEHLLNVALKTSILAAKIGMPRAGELIGLAHDLGKYSVAFQEYLRAVAGDAEMEMEPARGSVDHSTAGAQIVGSALACSDEGTGEAASEALALCLASHHSGLIDCILPNGRDELTRRRRKADSLSHRDEALRNLEPAVRLRLEALLPNPVVAAELGAAMERIRAVNDDEILQPFKQGLLLRMLFSCLIDADRTDTADFDKPAGARFRQHGEYTSWDQLIARLEEKLKTMPIACPVDQRRRDIGGHCLAGAQLARGIFTLTVPTGGGKTLASLRFALHHARLWGMRRVVYVSPYISIADQNAQVVRAVLEPEGCDFASVVLEHHSNLTRDKESWRSSVLAENWDAPVVFTTAVQVLEALFGGGTRSVRRLHALADAVIVFDEVQTLPVRVIHLFNNAVNFLVEQTRASVVLCTATQPLLDKVDKAKGAMGPSTELMPNAPQLFRDLRRYDTLDHTRQPGGWTAVQVSELAFTEMLEFGSCLVIVNTKRDALAIYLAWKERLKALPNALEQGCLVHLSTHMCPAHRLETLTRMKAALDPKAGKQVLCVSTQLIEAGVDIDFATVVRDLAGLDSIAQAAGRCNRNGTRPAGRIHIVKMGPLPSPLAEITRAQDNALRVLNDWRDEQGDKPFELSDPGQMRQFFKYHFFEQKQQMDYPVKSPPAERNDTLLRMLGQNGLAVHDARIGGVTRGGLMQSFASAAKQFRAIDSQTQGIVVPFGVDGARLIADLCAAHELGLQFRLLRKAQQFAVNVFPHEMKALTGKGAVYEAQKGTSVLCLHEDFYSEEFGLALDGRERMESAIA